MAINLQKGQKVDLTKGNPGLSKLIVGLGWDTNKYDGGFDFDLDAAAFLLGGEHDAVQSFIDDAYAETELKKPRRLTCTRRFSMRWQSSCRAGNSGRERRRSCWKLWLRRRSSRRAWSAVSAASIMSSWSREASDFTLTAPGRAD